MEITEQLEDCINALLSANDHIESRIKHNLFTEIKHSYIFNGVFSNDIRDIVDVLNEVLSKLKELAELKEIHKSTLMSIAAHCGHHIDAPDYSKIMEVVRSVVSEKDEFKQNAERYRRLCLVSESAFPSAWVTIDPENDPKYLYSKDSIDKFLDGLDMVYLEPEKSPEYAEYLRLKAMFEHV